MRKEEIEVGKYYWVAFGVGDAYVAEVLCVGDSESVVKLVSDNYMNGSVIRRSPDMIIGVALEPTRYAPRRPWWRFW